MKKKLLLVFLVLILIFIFTPIFGNFYNRFFGPTSTGFWGPDPVLVDGFFISYILFVTLAITIFGNKNKYRNLAIFLGILFLIEFGSWESMIIDLGVAIFSWFLAQIILFIKKRIKKTTIS